MKGFVCNQPLPLRLLQCQHKRPSSTYVYSSMVLLMKTLTVLLAGWCPVPCQRYSPVLLVSWRDSTVAERAAMTVSPYTHY